MGLVAMNTTTREVLLESVPTADSTVQVYEERAIITNSKIRHNLHGINYSELNLNERINFAEDHLGKSY